MSAVEKMLDTLLPPMPSVPPAIGMRAAPTICECGGRGTIVLSDERGPYGSRDCICRVEKGIDGRLRAAELPERYRSTTLDGYQAIGGHPSLGRSLAAARRFVEEYPIGTEGRGMLLVGPVGVGKTHLAVGVLRALVLGKGARGMFCDFRELLNRIKRTFNDKNASEAEIMDPVFAADVLVLDELGAARVTDWTFDAIENVINGRYNARRTTILTTNLPNLPPGGSAQVDGGADYGRAAASALRSETLGDRIGARMHSRLQEMCQVIEVSGDDYRVKKGSR